MPNDRKAVCPYYVTHKHGTGGWDYTITCEDIENNMGFDMRNQLRFPNREEQRDYLELFCCSSGFTGCPYYQAIYKKEGMGGGRIM